MTKEGFKVLDPASSSCFFIFFTCFVLSQNLKVLKENTVNFSNGLFLFFIFVYSNVNQLLK